MLEKMRKENRIMITDEKRHYRKKLMSIKREKIKIPKVLPSLFPVGAEAEVSHVRGPPVISSSC